ncbi:RNA-directed DNA polymerase, eukaryota, reverse transcriptase zinc-binding domain protein, partial [Tanacetum coccineum]
EWSSKFPELCQIEVPRLSLGKDKAGWISEGNKIVEYTTHNAWLTLRESWPKVKWCQVIWFSQCNPKQAIILWMAVQKKLLTQDRMGRRLKDWNNLNSLNDAVNHIAAIKQKNNIWKIMDKFIISSVVYTVWRERNRRSFQNVSSSDEEVTRTIIDNITNMLKSIKVKKSSEVLTMAQQWNLKYEKERLIASILAKALMAAT